MSNDNRNEGFEEETGLNRNRMKCPDFFTIMKNSDQFKDMPRPPLHKEASGEIISITADFEDVITNGSYTNILDIRRSERNYDTETPMTKTQLAFLLWSAQGVQGFRNESFGSFRPVASGGARHPFEIYFIARNVEGLTKGIYHYLPFEYIGEKSAAVEFVREFSDDMRTAEMVAGQKWASSAPVVVFLSCLPYRTEWRYSVLSHRIAMIDLGHVGQNLMLSASAMGLGSCCIAAYNQELCDSILGLDGYDEYTVYACAVGAVKR